jgi:Zn-dependent protease
MDPLSFIFAIIVLIMSVIAHELSHGYAAEMLGDPTARLSGRLTLNPLKHLDPIGSLVVPALSYLLGGFIFGWAKPVPYNPYNLRKGKLGEAIVAGAGIFTNIVLAVFFSLLIRFFGESFSGAFLQIVSLVVLINIVLAIFNLIPIPPLDGSKLLFSVLPFSMHSLEENLERFSLPLLLFVVFFLWQFLTPIIFFVFDHLTGISSLANL